MRRRSAPGIDGITWRQYRQDFHFHLESLSERLSTDEWGPGPIKLVRLQTFTGRERIIVVPTVEDRIVHRAMRNCIEPILESYAFLDFVSGYRFGRNRLTSVRQAMHYFADGRKWIVDIDIEDASGHVAVNEVIEWLACWISDGSFLYRVRKALEGLPGPLFPGGGLTPLLLNLRLVPVDHALKNLSVVRFVDNYAVFCSSIEEALEVFEIVREVLAKNHLAPAQGKSRVRNDANPEDLFLIGG